ncbi:DUF2637 domain-containing protein [Nocardia otitidiscaviarum]|uniref:DUF2637 domain-containing protein n=1 Tax=Nocardia otitidiscaviarum TaxID=1823 RepID=UPI00189355E7|nr:DUF2637 domain-containing protein [Nocardia otitidiscaviarum]MBF6132787.1 DUF2637 domain-containing protein [Nocardia otitidiscaviarum]
MNSGDHTDASSPDHEPGNTTAPDTAPGGAEETPQRFEEPAGPTEEPARETERETRSRRDQVEIAAIVSVVAVLLAACGWSAIALHDLAQQSGITSWLAWGAPVIVDGPLFQSAIALVVLKRRAQNGVTVAARHRRYFWGVLAAAELVSLVGNGIHAAHVQVTPAIAAVIAGAAPIAAMAVMHGLTILIEVPRIPPAQGTPGIAPQTLTKPQSEDVNTAVAVLVPGNSPAFPNVHPSAEEPARETPHGSEANTGTGAGNGEPFPEEPADSAERDARILALRDQGLSYRDIAPKVGLSHSRVWKILDRLKTEQAARDRGTARPEDGTGVVVPFVR